MSGPTNGGRARAYRALQESEELHRATLSSISDAVFLTDDVGSFTYICPNVDVIFGYTPDEVQAMATIDRLLGARLFDRADLAARGEIRNIERKVTSKTGESRSVLVHLKAVSIKGGTVLYTCRDITERRQAEDALSAMQLALTHASRLALVGELLGSIAHEIAQPLTAVRNNAAAGRRLAEGLADGQPIRDTLADIQSEADLATAMIERLRTLVRKRPSAAESIDVNGLVTDTVRLVDGEARRRDVRLDVQLSAPMPAVVADRVSIQQVVLNLLVNGMDAVDHLDAERRQLDVRTHVLAEAVEIAITDRGQGVAPEELSRLFDAFYTTKPQGLGLGLSIARSIVEAHGGRIEAVNNDGSGATFRVALPIRAQEHARAASEQAGG
jgi:PAS domain S-box-containing protein